MSATITDYFNKASNMSGSYPAVATVTAARSTGGSTLSCDDLSSWATDTPVHFSTFKVNTDGTIDTSTQTDWKGIVNGNTITDMTRLAGAADSGNASGDRVELNPTIGWLDDLITGILVSHKQNGALKDNAVTESSIATGAVTNTKLGDGSVTSAKIGTGAISSYDKIGDDVIQARNIDFSTFSGKRVETTELYSNGSATSGSITVSDYSGYDYMYFLISRNTNAGWATGIIKVSDFKNGKQYSFLSVTPDNTSRVFSIYGIALQYESDTKIKITKNCDIAFNASGIAGGPTTGGSLSVNKIIGIKLL